MLRLNLIVLWLYAGVSFHMSDECVCCFFQASWVRWRGSCFYGFSPRSRTLRTRGSAQRSSLCCSSSPGLSRARFIFKVALCSELFVCSEDDATTVQKHWRTSLTVWNNLKISTMCVVFLLQFVCFIQLKLKQHKRLKILCNQSVLHQQGEVYERVGHHHSAGSSSGKSAALRPGRRLPHREHLQCHKNRYVYEIFWSVELRYVAEYKVLFPPWFPFMQEKRVASRGSSLALGRKLRTWW